MLTSLRFKIQSSKFRFLLFFGFFFSIFSSAFATDIPRFYGDEVVVVASRYPQLMSESVASVTVVSGEDIQASGAVDVAGALRQVAGVDVKSSGYLAGETTLRLRGSTSDQVLLLIDGRRINSPQGAWAEIDNVSLDSIERIEVMRGPASSLYGADAIGGVVNVVTRQGTETATNVSASAGTFNTRSCSINQSFASGGLRTFLAAEAVRSDGFRPNGDYDGQTFSSRLVYDLSENVDLALAAGYHRVVKGAPNTITFPSLTDRRTDKKGYVDLSCRLGKVSVRAYQNQFDRLFSSFSVSRHKNWTEGLECALKLPDLACGFEWRQDRIGSTQNGSHAVNNLALFLEKEIQLTRRLKTVFGARGDQHSVFGNVLSPRVGLVYRPWPDTVLRTSWGGSFRAPNFDDLYWPAGTWAEGNPDLRPERAQTLDVGLERGLSESLTAVLGVFASDVRDMIAWTAGLDGIWRPANVNRARLRGGEFELRAKLSPAVSSFANYSYLWAVDAASGNRLTYKPKDKVNLGLRYNESAWQSYVTLRYVGEQYTDTANTDVLAAYTVVDTGLTIAPFTFKVNNVFDENYQESKDYPMPGRTYILEVVYKL